MSHILLDNESTVLEINGVRYSKPNPLTKGPLVNLATGESEYMLKSDLKKSDKVKVSIKNFINVGMPSFLKSVTAIVGYTILMFVFIAIMNEVSLSSRGYLKYFKLPHFATLPQAVAEFKALLPQYIMFTILFGIGSMFYTYMERYDADEDSNKVVKISK